MHLSTLLRHLMRVSAASLAIVSLLVPCQVVEASPAMEKLFFILKQSLFKNLFFKEILEKHFPKTRSFYDKGWVFFLVLFLGEAFLFFFFKMCFKVFPFV